MNEGTLSPQELKALLNDNTGAFGPDTSLRHKLELGLELTLELSVSLGNARKSIKEIMKLQTGTVIELDHRIDEPVEVLVNGKLIARGKIVSMGEHFGLQIISIEKPGRRLRGA